jgi:hypothetical protein
VVVELLTCAAGPATCRLCTWLSFDGGFSWTDIAEGTWIYEYADWGGVVVMSKHELSGPADEVTGGSSCQAVAGYGKPVCCVCVCVLQHGCVGGWCCCEHCCILKLPVCHGCADGVLAPAVGALQL